MSHVLIVEDSRHWQELFEEILAEDAHQVTTVFSREAALQVLDSAQIELAVVDINLTDVYGNRDGERVIEHINGRRPKIPIIVISGTVPADSLTLRDRVFAYLSKQSFDPETFSNKVKLALQAS